MDTWGILWVTIDHPCAKYGIGAEVPELPDYSDYPVRVNEECYLAFGWLNGGDEKVRTHVELELESPTGIKYTLTPVDPSCQDILTDPCYTGAWYWAPFGMFVFDELGTWIAKMRITETGTNLLLDEKLVRFAIVGEPSPSPIGAVGNRYLYGDLNYDGVVGFDDIQMVQSRIGKYCPEIDLDGDGFITEHDLRIVQALYGNVSPHYTVTRNPRFLEKGKGWKIFNWADVNPYFVFHLNFGQARAGTRYDDDVRGFHHYLDLWNFLFIIPIPYPEILPVTVISLSASGFTAATIGDDFQPADTNNPTPSPYDVPLNPKNQEFYIMSEIRDWGVSFSSWMTYGFGAWIILSQPYTMHIEATGPIFGSWWPPQDLTSRVIELVFCTKDQSVDPVTYFPKNVPIGAGKWNRIWPNLLPFGRYFLVFEYIMDDQPLGGIRTYHLDSSTLANLIDEIVSLSQTDEIVLANVPTPINSMIVSALSYVRLRNLNLRGAKIRPAFIGLQGKADFLASGHSYAHAVSHSFEFYDTKSGTCWKPTLSATVPVSVKK
jgi:hypothetical protein